MDYALYFVFCAVCVGNFLHSIRIKRYIRVTHPKLWNQFGFSGNGWWVPASKEAGELRSDLDLWSHLSAHSSKLHDTALDRMLKTHKILHALGALLFVAAAVEFIYSKGFLHGS
jgi:hypothetical protein